MIAMSRRRALRRTVAALVLAGTLFSIPAYAGDDPRVERRGGCSGTSTGR